MKFSRSLAASVAALAIATTPFTVPVTVAGAAEMSPAEVAGQVPLATIDELTTPVDDSSPKWRQLTEDDDRVQQLTAYSPSMNREIPLAVIPAAVENAPTIYLLNGAGGAEQDNDWITLAPTVNFYADKGVNVVIPMAGAFTYYLDWYEEPDGSFLNGPQKWETFLTKELPGPIEDHLQANDKRAVVGFSMSATSSLLFAEHNPGFYDAVGSFSGCAATADPATYMFTELTVNRAGATAAQMLGPQGGPHNVYNDALINAEGLRGAEIYISNGSGLAGEYDMPGPAIEQGVDPVVASANTARLVVEGGVIEAATNHCTHNLKAKLDSLNIPADYEFRPTGTHSWGYWRDDLEQSWPTIARGLELES